MVKKLFDRPLVPLASPDDAADTYEVIRPYLLQREVVPLLVHVVEKAGGAPDKIGVEHRHEHAENTFDAFRKRAQTDGVEVETEILYGTDIAGTIHESANEHDATAIVFSSRGESSWLNLVTGNVRANLIDEQDRPIIVLPDDGDLS